MRMESPKLRYAEPNGLREHIMSDDPNENPAEKPDAFAEPADWLAELREQYPEWEPPDPYDAVAMREASDDWWESCIEITDEQDHRVFTLSHELKRFLVLTEALARSAEANGLNSEPLIIFLQDAKSFYFGLQDRLPTAGEGVHVVVDRLKFKLEAQQHTSPSQAVPSPATPLQLTTAPPPNQGDEVVTEIDDLEARVSDDQEERRLKRSFDKPVIDREGFRLIWQGKIYTLKDTKEFWVLAHLGRNYGSWVHFRNLLTEVWTDSQVESNTVQKTVSNLRKKLKELGISDGLTIDGSNRDHYMLRRP